MVGKATVLSRWEIQSLDRQQGNAFVNSTPQFKTDLLQEIEVQELSLCKL